MWDPISSPSPEWLSCYLQEGYRRLPVIGKEEGGTGSRDQGWTLVLPCHQCPGDLWKTAYVIQGTLCMLFSVTWCLHTLPGSSLPFLDSASVPSWPLQSGVAGPFPELLERLCTQTGVAEDHCCCCFCSLRSSVRPINWTNVYLPAETGSPVAELASNSLCSSG